MFGIKYYQTVFGFLKPRMSSSLLVFIGPISWECDQREGKGFIGYKLTDGNMEDLCPQSNNLVCTSWEAVFIERENRMQTSGCENEEICSITGLFLEAYSKLSANLKVKMKLWGKAQDEDNCSCPEEFPAIQLFISFESFYGNWGFSVVILKISLCSTCELLYYISTSHPC